MMNVERGQIYFVAQGKNYMSEEGNARPAIIVSNDKINYHTDRCMVVYTTRVDHDYRENVPVMVKGTQSYAICGNINTIHKDRLRDFVGKVTEEEMKTIEEAMRYGLGIEEEEQENTDDSIEARCRKAEQNAALYKELFEQVLAKMTSTPQ